MDQLGGGAAGVPNVPKHTEPENIVFVYWFCLVYALCLVEMLNEVLQSGIHVGSRRRSHPRVV